MITTDLLTTWATLSPGERTSVRDVYFRGRSVAESACAQMVGVSEVTRALQSAYRQIAAFVLESEEVLRPAGAARPVVPALRALADLPTASWRWDTAREEMDWSDGLYELYGYPVGAVDPTIGLHQAHKQIEDRTTVERLVLASATESGAVVFPQRIVRTDGDVCRVVMQVVREPGDGEILTGRVVADLAA